MFVTFPASTQPGQPQAQQCVNFVIINDQNVETFEAFTVSATPAGDFPIALGGPTANINILDDDGKITINGTFLQGILGSVAEIISYYTLAQPF